MLQVENISFSYRKGRKEVLSDFSLSLEAAGFTVCWVRTEPASLRCSI